MATIGVVGWVIIIGSVVIFLLAFNHGRKIKEAKDNAKQAIPQPVKVPHKVYQDPQDQHYHPHTIYKKISKVAHRKWEHHLPDGTVVVQHYEGDQPVEVWHK